MGPTLAEAPPAQKSDFAPARVEDACSSEVRDAERLRGSQHFGFAVESSSNWCCSNQASAHRVSGSNSLSRSESTSSRVWLIK